jgi:hypothetical protein
MIQTMRTAMRRDFSGFDQHAVSFHSVVIFRLSHSNRRPRSQSPGKAGGLRARAPRREVIVTSPAVDHLEAGRPVPPRIPSRRVDWTL